MHSSKVKFLVLFAVFLGLIFTFYTLYNKHISNQTSDQKFLNTLKGEIVYSDRVGNDKDLNIYVISANGKNRRLVYTHHDSINANCLFPRWSSVDNKIHFTAMHDRKWSEYSVNFDGSNPEMIPNGHPNTITNDTRADDIYWDRGSIFYLDSSKNKIYIYRHENFSTYNRGASEASWSPDKKFILFVLHANDIMIADREGTKIVKVTNGQMPDWKY